MAITNKELFNKVNDIMKKGGIFPACVDEIVEANGADVELVGCGWHVAGELTAEFGNAFLDLYLSSDGNDRIHLGTYRSYSERRVVFNAMGVLQANFVWEMNDFIKHNLVLFMPSY